MPYGSSDTYPPARKGFKKYLADKMDGLPQPKRPGLKSKATEMQISKKKKKKK